MYTIKTIKKLINFNVIIMSHIILLRNNNKNIILINLELRI